MMEKLLYLFALANIVYSMAGPTTDYATTIAFNRTSSKNDTGE